MENGMNECTPSKEPGPSGETRRLPLAKWLWKAYLRAAVIPLLAIELTFLGAYWASNLVTYDRNVAVVTTISKDSLERTATREAQVIAGKLAAISALADVYAFETGRALETPDGVSAEEKARYALSPEGAFHTTRDNGGSAAFYSGVIPIGEKEKEKVWRTVSLDPLMKSIKNANPLITQIYFNTNDSYNRIYPYFDVLSVYEPKMDIPSYNFYYEADAAHNPGRKAVWTDAYVDPAGSGWMVSAIAPVYGDAALEAVVGIDITIEAIIKQVLNINLPWDGYALLVGRDGTILALPPRGEGDWGLRELTSHGYEEAIKQDTFKPDDFNIFKRGDAGALSAAIKGAPRGIVQLSLKEPMVAAWTDVEGPGWKLVVMAPERGILADANALRGQLSLVGWLMVAGLLAFYVVFFVFLWNRARSMSRHVARSLGDIENVIGRIGEGAYRQPEPDYEVTELQTVGTHLVRMGEKLGDAYTAVVAAEQTVRDSLEKERYLGAVQRQFVNVVSHEFRTPLTIIDGAAQALERRADRMSFANIVERARSVRQAVRRLTEVMDSALSLSRMEDGAVERQFAEVDVGRLTEEVAENRRAVFPDHTFIVSHADGATVIGSDTLLRIAFSAVVENAARYSPAGSTVEIEIAPSATGGARLRVQDHGLGISEEEKPKVFDRFFRGEAGMSTHGVGIGLYVAREFIGMHGGLISLEDTLGGGTTVEIELPGNAARERSGEAA